MSTIPGDEGPTHPLSTPIEALTVVCTAPYNHRVAGIRNCENAFHLASTILGGATLSKSSPLPEFGRFLTDGSLPKL
jgi:hypothetical protein